MSETPDTTIVSVVFREVDNFSRSTGNRVYSYITDLKLKPKDLVVIPVVDSTRDDEAVGYAIGQIKAVEGLSRDLLEAAEHFILYKINVKAFEKKMQEKKTVDELRYELNRRKSEIEDMILYKKLGKADPKIRRLVKKLEKFAPDLKLLESEEKSKT